MNRNNSGFSLVELLVSVSILSVVAAAAVGFMSSGANSFSSIAGRLSLQLKSQLAMNNIQEHLIDCNEGIYISPAGDTLYIINSENGPSGTDYTACVYRYDSGSEAIYFGDGECTFDEDTGQFVCSVTVSDLLAGGVSSFSATKTTYATLDDEEKVLDVTLQISFYVRSKSFTGLQTTSLRNRPNALTVVAGP